MNIDGSTRVHGGLSRRLRAAAICLMVLVLGIAGVQQTGAAAPAAAGNPGGIHGVQNAIPGQYIVTLQETDAGQVPGVAAGLAHAHGGAVLQVYTHALTGFAVRMNAAQALALSHDPHVASVEEDGVVSVDTTQTESNVPSWGLDRVDQRNLPLDTAYTWDDHLDGNGVTVYILDTGIRITNQDFGGRASWGTNTVDSATTDGNGHGTHVAGIVGGTTYGVAKNVHLVAVKVLTDAGSGANSGVIAGIDWVIAHAVKPAVINMSLGGSTNTSMNDAVDRAVKSGVMVVVAAGNNNADACNSSPASAPDAVTVGASTDTDAKATFSNYGRCVDLFAPGKSITSDWYTSDTATNTISGTSMASPFVAGVAAQYLESHPTSTPPQVAAAIDGNATPDHLAGLPEGQATPSLLLYSGSSFYVPTVPDAPVLTGTPQILVAHLTWTKPPDNGAPITHYIVYVFTVPGLTSAAYYVNATSIGFPMQPGTTNYFSVRAVNAVGEGPVSNQVVVSRYF